MNKYGSSQKKFSVTFNEDKVFEHRWSNKCKNPLLQYAASAASARRSAFQHLQKLEYFFEEGQPCTSHLTTVQLSLSTP